MKNLISYLNQNFFLSLDAAQKLAGIIIPMDIEAGIIFVGKGRPNQYEYLLLEVSVKVQLLMPMGQK